MNGQANEYAENGHVKNGYTEANCGIIGSNIRKHRKLRRFTVEELADRMDLSISFITLLERGERCPGLNTLYKLCDLFQITPNDLLMPPAESTGHKHAAAAGSMSLQQKSAALLMRDLSERDIGFLLRVLEFLHNRR